MGSYFAQGSSAELPLEIITNNSTTILDVDSKAFIQLTGLQNHIVQLPNCANLYIGRYFLIRNRSAGIVYINYDDGSLLQVLLPNASKDFYLLQQSSNGVWDTVDNDNIFTLEFTAGEDLSIGKAVYISMGILDGGRTAGNVYRTDATISFRKNFVGFVSNNVLTGEMVVVQRMGTFYGLGATTSGLDYYLDPAILGGITNTVPDTTGVWAVVIGIGNGAGTGLVIDSAAPRFAWQIGAKVADGVTTITTTGGTTTLEYGSTTVQRFIGNNTQVVKLISGYTPEIGRFFRLQNRSTKVIDVQYNDGSLADKIAPETEKVYYLTENSLNGVWDIEENSSNNVQSFLAGESLTIGKFVYISAGASDSRTAGSVYKTDVTNIKRRKAAGVVLNDAVSVGEYALIQRLGSFYGYTGLTVGAEYYLDATGDITISATSGVRIGTATSSNILEVDAITSYMSSVFEILSGGGFGDAKISYDGSKIVLGNNVWQLTNAGVMKVNEINPVSGTSLSLKAAVTSGKTSLGIPDPDMHTSIGYAKIWSPVAGLETTLTPPTYNFDCGAKHIWRVTGGSKSIVLNNFSEGQTVNVVVESTGSSYTISWSGQTFRWNSGLVPVPTVTSSRYDVYTFLKVGGVVYGVAALNMGS